ncbi:MAG: hypothetical protein GPJ54_04365 [Candidatus Heimdallarchaeota archaeon]|nr:hypothetical protein [Candidatus Heimdallarchaeota archaeon]
MDIEKNPTFKKASSFNGTCKKCENKTEVRYLKAYPEISYNFQRSTIIGPYDRYCAYTEKLGSIPIFYTQPKGLFEEVYRYLTRLEMPYGKNRRWKMMYNFIVKLGISFSSFLLFLLGFSLSMIVFVPLMIIMAPFMILQIIYLPLLVVLVIRFIRMGLKNSGLTKSSNFEKFWDGKINKQDKQLNFYIRKIIIYTPVILIFRWLLSLENRIMSYIEQNETPFSLLFPDIGSVLEYIEPLGITQFKLTVGILFFFFIGMISSYGRYISWDKYTAMPKDVHQIALERKREEKSIMSEKTSITIPPERRSRNPFVSITKLFMPNPQEHIDFICQICKTQVDENELDVYCDNCCRYFHEEHIVTHLNELEKDNKDPICPVCYFDAKIVFSEIEW